MTWLRSAPLLLLLDACMEQAPPAPPPAQAPAASPAPTSIPSSAPSPTPSPVLTPQGYDTIRIGARPGEVGYDLRDEGTYDGACRIWTSTRLPGLSVLVEDGVIRRVTLWAAPDAASPIRTARGIAVGATEAEVRAAYRPLGEEPHEYGGPPAKNLYWGEEGVPEALRFEMDEEGRVQALHAGESPQLRYSESCS